MLGLLIMFHWVILFIENILTYNPYYYFHWFVIGLCMSTSFRNQNEKEVKAWLNFGLKAK
jgi:cell division protein FtsW (lipid II flippase)